MTWSRGVRPAGDAVEARLTRAAFVGRASGAGLALVLGGGAARLLAGAGGGASAAGAAPAVHRFRSRPDLSPPVLTAVRPTGGRLAPGLIFMTPGIITGQMGTLIADNRGEPVWFGPTTESTTNLRVAAYRGKPALTWWEGNDAGGLGRGTHVIADDGYRVIARVAAGNGLPSDLHEFIITPAGTALVTAWETTTRDLRRYGGPARGTVVGGVVQELELPSGRVLFEWHSLDHVGLQESHAAFQPKYRYFDYFHVNSIAPSEDGNLLVSARNTWAIYKIDRGSGAVIWRLGGRRSDFQMGPGTQFAWQHDARPHAGGLLSLFDDGAAPRVQPESRGLVLALDTVRMRATLLRAYPHSPPVLAFALGNVQLLPNGNVLVGYGTASRLTEFSADGTPLLDLRLPGNEVNYRGFRFPWIGRPLDRPRLALDSTGLYVSWNGATEVSAWELRAGPASARLRPAETRSRAGFETAFPLPAGARYAVAVARDGDGRPLAESNTVEL